MAERAWRDLVVGDRMRVDQEFAPRVRQSGLTNQEWSLVMTAVELEVQGTGDEATLVADTSRVPDIVPEMNRLQRQMGPYAAGGGDADRRSGLFDSLRSVLGLGGSTDAETVRQAEELASAYAAELEAHLRENGKWAQVLELR